MQPTDPFLAAFADPARDSQAIFRHILNATAYAGRIETIDIALTPPAGLGVAAAALLLTLTDDDVSLRLSSASHARLAHWLRFHCGCPLVTGERLDTAFALVGVGEDCPPLDSALLADPERPDLSTTLVLECEALEGGAPMRATGPGIDGVLTLAPKGLPAGFRAEREALRPLLPLGVDIYLTAGRQLMALPRSISLEEID
jgi:alpha-D-ribose 1-methylphosphonate 5-triphosphate synthase subunit PhnH